MLFRVYVTAFHYKAIIVYETFVVLFQTCNLQRMEKEQRRKATPKPQTEPQFVFQVTNIPLFSSENGLVCSVVNLVGF